MKKSYKNISVTLLGGDNRMDYLADILKNKGYSVKKIYEETETVDLNCHYLILPLPLTQDGVHLNCQWENKPKLVDIIGDLQCKTMVLAGCVSERVADMFQQKGIRWRDYYTSERLQRQNAYLTAEATLQLVMQNLNKKIKGTSVLIIGSGRCGKEAAKLFKKMGAKVTLTSRKIKDKVKTLLLGVKPAQTSKVGEIASKYQVIINTVPHPVLTKSVLKTIKKSTFVIELASLAAGVDLQAASKLGTELLYAPGLPGRYLPFSAAESISETIIKIIKEDSM